MRRGSGRAARENATGKSTGERDGPRENEAVRGRTRRPTENEAVRGERDGPGERGAAPIEETKTIDKVKAQVEEETGAKSGIYEEKTYKAQHLDYGTNYKLLTIDVGGHNSVVIFVTKQPSGQLELRSVHASSV
ncbi:hypothetical protein WMY93_020064 [Mugilogobius chulae]|uniref:Uncharacterized protein n=1 Tax=Mugilogobius chulae TaxID=88201 RepID=A0AAW0NMY9_9GOBI